MKRLLLASAALVALTGAAHAQEAPYLSGNYSASVARSHSPDANRGRGAYSAGPRVYYRDDGPRVYYRDTYRPRYVYRDYYDDDYYRPRHHYRRHAFAPRAGFSIGFGGPGWGVGIYDYRR